MRLVCFVLVVSSALSQGNLPDLSPAVRGMFPLGGRHGETVQVEIQGRHLDEAQSFTFVDPEIQARIRSSEFFSLKAEIVVGLRAHTGMQGYRLTTSRGSYAGGF